MTLSFSNNIQTDESKTANPTFSYHRKKSPYTSVCSWLCHTIKSPYFTNGIEREIYRDFPSPCLSVSLPERFVCAHCKRTHFIMDSLNTVILPIIPCVTHEAYTVHTWGWTNPTEGGNSLAISDRLFPTSPPRHKDNEMRIIKASTGMSEILPVLTEKTSWS